MESFCRDFLNDTAEHSPILKVTKNLTTPVLVSHPEQVKHTPRRGFVFGFCQQKMFKLSILNVLSPSLSLFAIRVTWISMKYLASNQPLFRQSRGQDTYPRG